MWFLSQSITAGYTSISYHTDFPDIFRQFHVSKRRHVTSERLKSLKVFDCCLWLSITIEKWFVNHLVTGSPVPGQVLLRVLGWLLICSSYGSTLSGLPLTHSLHIGTGSVGIVQEVNIWYTLTWMEKDSHWLLVALLLSAAGPHWMGHSLLRSLYEHGLNLIKPWISDHMPSKMWDGIIYPQTQRWYGSRERISNFIPHFIMGVTTNLR